MDWLIDSCNMHEASKIDAFPQIQIVSGTGIESKQDSLNNKENLFS